jgi:hypothetical protein
MGSVETKHPSNQAARLSSANAGRIAAPELAGPHRRLPMEFASKGTRPDSPDDLDRPNVGALIETSAL